MRLTVVTALLLLLGVLNIVTPSYGNPDNCDMIKEVDCGDGWIQAHENYCVKYVKTAKTFQDAQVECDNHGAHLVKIHRFEHLFPLYCFTVDKTPASERQNIWINKERSENEEEQAELHSGEDCVEMDAKVWGEFNDVPCSNKNFFVCGKKVNDEPDQAQ